MWIGTDENGCCRDQRERAMWMEKNVTGSFHVKFEVIFGLEQMMEDDILT
jgi:hypothetical protein